MKTTITLIKSTDSMWEPQSLYWSHSTEDLLVGMYRKYTQTGKVIRYNRIGQLKQTIQHDDTGLDLYGRPSYLIENNNGDIVVSCFSAVVVTESGGKHRFSYTGHPSGSGFLPVGICIDALSHILVCDPKSKTVQMINKDGVFLSHLLTYSKGMNPPWSLSYDIKTHRLWVGLYRTNKVLVYRTTAEQDTVTDEDLDLPEGYPYTC